MFDFEVKIPTPSAQAFQKLKLAAPSPQALQKLKIPSPSPQTIQKLKNFKDRCCRFGDRSKRRVIFGLGAKRSKSAPFYFRDSVESTESLKRSKCRGSPSLGSTPPPCSKPWLFSSTPTSSPVSTPGFSRRSAVITPRGSIDNNAAAARVNSPSRDPRNSPYRVSGPPAMPRGHLAHSASEPVMNAAALYRATARQAIKKTSLGVLAAPASYIGATSPSPPDHPQIAPSPAVMRVKNASLGSPVKRPLSVSLSPLYEERRKCSEECVVCAFVKPELRGKHSSSVTTSEFGPSCGRNFH